MNHLEGGWPRDVDPMDASQVDRLAVLYCTVLYCTVLRQVGRVLKRAEREEGFLEAVTKLSGEAEHQLRLNLALDIYQEIFPSLEEEEEEGGEAEQARLDTVAVVRDPAPGPGTSARPVSCVSWGRGHGAESSLAVAYSSPELLASLQFGSRDGFIRSAIYTLISTISTQLFTISTQLFTISTLQGWLRLRRCRARAAPQ